MNLKLGDFVRFVDENIEGYITRIIDKDTIGVTDNNDCEIPVLATKVTLVYGDIPENDIVSNKPATTPLPDKFVHEGIYLGIITDQHSNSVVHFNIINESSYQLLLSLTTEKGNIFKGEFANIIAPHSAKKIFSEQLADIQIWPKFHLEILFHTATNNPPKAAVLVKRYIKGKDLSVAKEEIAMLKQKGWLIRLDELKPLIDAEKLKQSFFRGS